MEFLFELIGELLLEGGMEISHNQKISRWIRYPLLIVIGLFFLSVFIVMMVFGFLMIKESHIVIGLIVIGIDLFLMIWSIRTFRHDYIERRGNIK